MLKRYIIERELPGLGDFSPEDLCKAARTSNEALSQLAPAVQWQHSYVTDNGTFCVYLAENEEAVHAHAEKSGFPVKRIIEATKIIDPVTANG